MESRPSTVAGVDSKVGRFPPSQSVPYLVGAMEILERYELILSQALEELGPVDFPEEAEKQFEVQALLAPDLGDILYRLSVEHGVAFTPFRETVISLISEPREAMAAHRRGPGSERPFAVDLEHAHALILLSLEMMPPDAPF